MDHGEGRVRFRASVGGFRGRAECSWDPLNKSPRPSHPRNGRMTALPFAVNSAAIDSKCRLVLHPVPWRAGSRDLFRGSLERSLSALARHSMSNETASDRVRAAGKPQRIQYRIKL